MYIYKAMKVRVISGDTIKCWIDLGFNVCLQSMKVKLLNIKAPDGIDGEKARKYLDDILPDKFSIKTRIDEGLIIADIMSGGESINSMMLEATDEDGNKLVEKFSAD